MIKNYIKIICLSAFCMASSKVMASSFTNSEFFHAGTLSDINYNYTATLPGNTIDANITSGSATFSSSGATPTSVTTSIPNFSTPYSTDITALMMFDQSGGYSVGVNGILSGQYVYEFTTTCGPFNLPCTDTATGTFFDSFSDNTQILIVDPSIALPGQSTMTGALTADVSELNNFGYLLDLNTEVGAHNFSTTFNSLTFNSGGLTPVSVAAGMGAFGSDGLLSLSGMFGYDSTGVYDPSFSGNITGTYFVTISYSCGIFGLSTCYREELRYFSGSANGTRLIGVGNFASVVPVPTAIWLFGSGLLGLIGFAKRKKSPLG